MIETPERDQPTNKGMAVVALSLVIVVALGVWALTGSKPDRLPDIKLTDLQRAQLIARMRQVEIKPKVGVGPIRLGINPDEVIAVLGQPALRKDEFQTTLHYRKLGLYLVFGMQDNELGSIVCLSNTGETMSSRNNNPPLTFAGATKDGIRVGSDFADLKAKWGESDIVDHPIFTQSPDQSCFFGRRALDHGRLSLVSDILCAGTSVRRRSFHEALTGQTDL